MTHWAIPILLALSLVTGVPASVRQGEAPEMTVRRTQTVSHLTMARGTTGRVPVVIFVAGSDEAAMGGIRSLANVLAADGIASLRYDRPVTSLLDVIPEFEAAVAEVAATVSGLRNDIRFSTITVAGDLAGESIGAIAARVARADTFVTFSLDTFPAATVTKAVRDLDLPGAPKPRRNPGQRASLRATTIATIDGARVAVEYGRPSKRSRVIWGNLVKWGGWWMPGADEGSTFSTNRTLEFGSVTVPAGDYTLYAQPDPEAFTLIINRQTGQFHTVYNPDQDLGRLPMIREVVEPAAEQLTFAIRPRPDGGGTLKLIWDDRAYVASFVVQR